MNPTEPRDFDGTGKTSGMSRARKMRRGNFIGRLRSAELGFVPAFRSSPELNVRLREGLRKEEISAAQPTAPQRWRVRLQ